MFNVIHGDLFEIPTQAYAHGVNCKGAMGSGIAVDFKTRYPEMHEYYKGLCTQFGDRLAGQSMYWRIPDGDSPGVFNLFSQVKMGANAKYSLIESSVMSMALMADEMELDRVTMPAIGCGVGGLELSEVVPLMKEILGPFVTDYTMIIRP